MTISLTLQAFEGLLFGDRPTTEKRKRDTFKKLVEGIIGVSSSFMLKMINKLMFFLCLSCLELPDLIWLDNLRMMVVCMGEGDFVKLGTCHQHHSKITRNSHHVSI